MRTAPSTQNGKCVPFTVKLRAEVDLEIVRIVKHVKETASFFELGDTETDKNPTLFRPTPALPQLSNEKPK